jgi:hypothetical protein
MCVWIFSVSLVSSVKASDIFADLRFDDGFDASGTFDAHREGITDYSSHPFSLGPWSASGNYTWSYNSTNTYLHMDHTSTKHSIKPSTLPSSLPSSIGFYMSYLATDESTPITLINIGNSSSTSTACLDRSLYVKREGNTISGFVRMRNTGTNHVSCNVFTLSSDPKALTFGVFVSPTLFFIQSGSTGFSGDAVGMSLLVSLLNDYVVSFYVYY